MVTYTFLELSLGLLLLAVGFILLVRRMNSLVGLWFQLLGILSGLNLLLYGSLAWVARRGTWRLDVLAIGFFAQILVMAMLDRKRRHGGQEKKGGLITRRIAAALSIFLALVGLVSVWLFPADDLPPPTGPYRIGTASFSLEDRSRLGVYLDQPDQHRRLMVQYWYPTEQDGRTDGLSLAPWIPDRPLRDALAAYANLPAFMMSQLAVVQSNSWLNARIAAGGADGEEGGLPLVVISHGWTGHRFIHTDLAEALASHGLLVMAIDHSYGSLSVSLPDGTVLPIYPEALPPASQAEAFAAASAYLVATYQADIEAVLASVRLGILPDSLVGLIDTQRIALVGHSTGAGAVARVVSRETGIRAVLGLDAWLEPLGAAVDRGSAVPQLHFGSAQWEQGKNRSYVDRWLDASPQATIEFIAGSAHMDFAMLRHLTRGARFLGWGGSINQTYFAELVNGEAVDWLIERLTD